MTGYTLWATALINLALASFHRYSLFVWLFWLVLYLGGAVLGMT